MERKCTKDVVPIIEKTIEDLVSDFLYYDRKEDEELPRGCIEKAIQAGELSATEIIQLFQAALMRGLNPS